MGKKRNSEQITSGTLEQSSIDDGTGHVEGKDSTGQLVIHDVISVDDKDDKRLSIDGQDCTDQLDINDFIPADDKADDQRSINIQDFIPVNPYKNWSEVDIKDHVDRSMWVQDLWQPIEESGSLTSKKIKVAAYCRVSVVSSDKCDSLINQVDHFTRLISAKPEWKFVGIYFDNSVSGKNVQQRHGFTRMLRHVSEGKIDLILTKNISRFSRNTQELMEILNQLDGCGAEVYFENENILSSDKNNQFLISTYAGLAQAEIESSSSAIAWGFEKRFISGRPLLSNVYGYRTSIDGYEIVSDQAAVIRQIYAMCLEGNTYTKIAKWLMVQNVKTYLGKDLWSVTVVKSILTNEAYIGSYTARKRTSELFSGRSKPTDGLRKQYQIENSHPAIVDEDTYHQVQEMIITKSRTYTKTQLGKIKLRSLSERIKCGICGYNYHHSQKTSRHYWKCPTRVISKDVCGAKNLSEEAIREMFLSAINLRFNLTEDKSLKELLTLIQMVNQNDHLEFHRLKALNAIELAEMRVGIEFTEEEIKELKRCYIEFEKKLDHIETDRKYRDEAIKWLKEIKSAHDFITEATIDYLRAWVIRITIFSEDDFEVFWIDDQSTCVGDCSPRIREKKVSNIIFAEPSVEIRGRSDPELETGISVKPKSVDLMKQVTHSIKGSNIIRTIPIKTDKAKIRVAAYVRVSTESDLQMMSLKAQTAYYTYAILKNPQYEFAGIYVDEGITGTSIKSRDDFNRMIEDCTAGKIDLIITKSISRFSRNVVDTLKYIQYLSNLDKQTHVFFERENISTENKDSAFMISLLAAVSQEESRNSGTSIAWAKRSMAKRGIIKHHQPGYGYKIGKNHEWHIIEEEAEIVRRIYREFLEGRTYARISKGLRDDQIPISKWQKAWEHSIIKRILHREEYRGNYLFQKVHRGESIEYKRIINKGELPQYLIENHHPAIIDSQTWELVQAEIERREEERKGKIKYKYPKGLGKNEAFVKKLYCGECGSLMGFYRQLGFPKSGKYYHNWRCNEGYKSRCDNKPFYQNFLEVGFSQMLLDIQMNPRFDDYVNRFKSEIRLNEDELTEMNVLEDLVEDLNQELYIVVEGELGKKGKDTKRVDELTEKIVALKDQIREFTKREEQVQAIDAQILEMRKALGDRRIEESAVDKKKRKQKTETNIEIVLQDEFGYYEDCPDFNSEQFERWIEKGITYSDGRLSFRFKAGFEWAVPFVYDDYKERLRAIKRQEKAAEKEAYFNGPQVKKLLTFCKEPKSLAEMYEFFGKYSDKYVFKEWIVTPLLEREKLKLTMPDQPSSRFQKYYSGRTRKF